MDKKVMSFSKDILICILTYEFSSVFMLVHLLWSLCNFKSKEFKKISFLQMPLKNDQEIHDFILTLSCQYRLHRIEISDGSNYDCSAISYK